MHETVLLRRGLGGDLRQRATLRFIILYANAESRPSLISVTMSRDRFVHHY